MRMAQDAGLDLVEIQPDVRPPLCKIMDYGKHRYEQSKKKSGGSKQPELKEIRLGRSAKIDDHDVEIRLNQAKRFIIQGHKVQFIQRFRGREMAFREIGQDRLDSIAEELADIAKVESPPRQNGRQMSMTVAPDRPKVEALRRKMEKENKSINQILGLSDDEPQDLNDTDHEGETAQPKAEKEKPQKKSKDFVLPDPDKLDMPS